jgi:hypothetical protein
MVSCGKQRQQRRAWFILMLTTLLLFLMAAQPDLFSPHGEKAVVLLFVRSDCPISNRYAPEIEGLYAKYSPASVDFRLIYTEAGLSSAAMEHHREEYGYKIPGELDAGHRYVKRAGVRATPEAAVFVGGQLVYRGRIDDRFVDFGKVRASAEHHDLEEVLAAIVAGKVPRFRETRAFGCAIESLQ